MKTRQISSICLSAAIVESSQDVMLSFDMDRLNLASVLLPAPLATINRMSRARVREKEEEHAKKM